MTKTTTTSRKEHKSTATELKYKNTRYKIIAINKNSNDLKTQNNPKVVSGSELS